MSTSTAKSGEIARPGRYLTRSRLPQWVPSGGILVAWIVGVGLIWQASASFGWINPLFTSSPIAIGQVIPVLFSDPSFLVAIWTTIWELLVAFVASAVIGIVLGLIAGSSTIVYRAVQPPVSALYATPRVALLPIFVLWLGIGSISRIGFVVSVAVLPIFISTTDGVRIVDRDLLRVARVFQASRSQTFRTVIVPHAIPQIISGLRVGLIMSLLSIVVAQIYIGSNGLGYLLTLYGNNFQTDRLMVVVIISAVLGLLFMYPMNVVERHFDRWRSK